MAKRRANDRRGEEEGGEVVSRVFGLAVIKATNIKKLHAGGRRSCLAHTHTHTPEKLKQLANKRKTNKKPLTSNNNNNNEHIVKQKTQTWLAQIWRLPIMAAV